MEDEEFVNLDSEINDAGPSNGINPAWNDVLNIIPEELHSQITPHFQNWDHGVQNKIQQVHSEYSPYKFLKENEISDEDVRIALGVMRAVQEDPRAVYDSLAESYGYGSGEEQGSAETNQVPGFENLPPQFMQQFNQLQTGYDTMAKILLAKQEQEEQARADAEFQQTISNLKKQHGNFDEGYVIQRMISGEEPDEAIQAWNNLKEQIMVEANRPKPPRLLGAGSGVPGTQAVDPRKLDSSGTKDLVMQMLKAAASQNQ